MAKKSMEIQKRGESTMQRVSTGRAEARAITAEASTVVEYVPAIDILETGDEYFVIADMPGVDEKHLHITVDKNVLSLEGWRDVLRSRNEWSHEPEKETWLYRRQIRLGEGIERDRVEANYHNGVLRVRLPKSENMRAKKIPVKKG